MLCLLWVCVLAISLFIEPADLCRVNISGAITCQASWETMWWHAIGPLIYSAYFTMCSSSGLLGAVTGSTQALVPVWQSVTVHSMNKTWLWSTLRGVPKNTPASLPGLRMVDASIFMGDGTHKFCTRGHAILCRLALTKGAYWWASHLRPRVGPACIMCVWDPSESYQESSPILVTNERWIAWVGIASWYAGQAVWGQWRNLLALYMCKTLLKEVWRLALTNWQSTYVDLSGVI
jgi:hypothetical protein